MTTSSSAASLTEGPYTLYGLNGCLFLVSSGQLTVDWRLGGCSRSDPRWAQALRENIEHRKATPLLPCEPPFAPGAPLDAMLAAPERAQQSVSPALESVPPPHPLRRLIAGHLTGSEGWRGSRS